MKPDMRQKPPVNRSRTIRRLMQYVKRGYGFRFLLVLVCILISAIASVSGSLFLGSLIDVYITDLLAMDNPVFDGLLHALILMGCLYLAGALCALAYNRLMVTISQGVQKKIRDDLFSHMQSLPIKYFDTHAHGDVMSVYTNDVDTLRQMFSQSIPQVINSLMMIVVAFVGMIFTNLLLTGVVILCIIAMLLVPRFLPGTPAQRGVWKYALAFPNVGFIGYPVAVALFGDGALFYAAILALPFNLLSYSLGPLLLVGAARFRWKQLFTPCIVASVLGLVLALTRLRPPSLVGEMLDFVGDITVPLSLLVVGSLLAGMSAGQVFRSPTLWALTAIRLLALPVALCLILRAMGIDSMVLGIAVTQMAMPVAVNGTLLSMEYGGDTECMAQITFLTTAASILTIPIVAVLLL